MKMSGFSDKHSKPNPLLDGKKAEKQAGEKAENTDQSEPKETKKSK